MQTNEKPQHTPGPWKISAGSTEGDGFTVCQSPEGKMIADLRDSWLSEVQANARLIAAAPELLAALRRISALCTRLTESQGYNEDGNAEWLGPIVYEMAEKAFQATTKATGAA